MASDVTRRNFVKASAVMGAGIALGGPMTAYAQRAAAGRGRPSATGYGALRPTPEIDSGIEFLALPPGFRYRLLNRSGDPMTTGGPTPGIFDGMGAYAGPGGSTILIRNHENRSRAGEITVPVPAGKRYDPDANVRGGNTKLIVDRRRRVDDVFAVLGGTHTNCAGGETPWRTWITCEEIFNYGAVENNVTPGTGVPHGYSFEVPADATGAVTAQPIVDAGRFAHEAVAWLDGILYETEDRGDAAFYRFVPARRPREFGDLASFGGTLQALVVSGRPGFDANLANPGDSLDCEWVTIEEPNPLVDTVRKEAQDKGAAIFDRTEGAWTAGRRVYFDCTTGGEAQLGQLWSYEPRGRDGGRLTLIYESTSSTDLENPDNLVIVPASGDVFLQEDSDGEQFVRGVTQRGRIYDFAQTLLSDYEFCGGCFGPDGRTFFLNQQGDRLSAGQAPADQPLTTAGLTYAIWGPFGGGHDHDDDD
ncbi:MAG TPA: alkaline phosphatase PhoX [Solirubrobacteraceae bacterium]|nr:alkaline phosphatase PhoX [Solirubrobacteraceae bacterium]